MTVLSARVNVCFSEAEDYECTQEIELSAADVREDSKPIALNPVKFQKTDKLTVRRKLLASVLTP